MFASTSLTPKEVIALYRKEIRENHAVKTHLYFKGNEKFQWLPHIENNHVLPCLVCEIGKRVYFDIDNSKRNILTVMIEEYIFDNRVGIWKLAYAYNWEYELNSKTAKLYSKFIRGFAKYNEQQRST